MTILKSDLRYEQTFNPKIFFQNHTFKFFFMVAGVGWGKAEVRIEI